jgi:hypothetical protein
MSTCAEVCERVNGTRSYRTYLACAFKSYNLQNRLTRHTTYEIGAPEVTNRFVAPFLEKIEHVHVTCGQHDLFFCSLPPAQKIEALICKKTFFSLEPAEQFSN